ncbi:MAG: gliding motility-associated ABC transporter substrate-binding protein GldG [Flavobacteriales bacterium]
MFSLYKKELTPFFGNTSGYIVVSIFIIFCTLYLFFFENDFNILNGEIASLDSFFTIAPWALIFMIPALTMRSFAEERQTGTIELLFTQPLSKKSITITKYGAVLTVALSALLLTLFFPYSIQQLTYLDQPLDWGIIFSGYIGLIFLASSFAAIGIFISSIMKNSITAYLCGVFSCFFIYFGFTNLASYNLFGSNDYIIDQLGFYSHYTTFIKGIISFKSVFYFMLIIFFFLTSTYFSIKSSKKKYILLLFPPIILTLLFFNFWRLDITQDQRYTLSGITEKVTKKIENPVKFEIYLEGDFPADLRMFHNEIKRTLQELQQINSHIEFEFVDPFRDENTTKKLNDQKINAIVKRVKTDKGTQEFYIYPYAKAVYQGKQWVFPLIKNINLPVENNMEDLEFIFTKALSEITKNSKKKIGIFVHHGEFDPKTHQTFYKILDNRYDVKPFVPLSKEHLTSEEAQKLNDFDIVLIVDPQNTFSDTDREAVDQFIMNGGKTLWLIDGVNTEIDSLYQTGKSTVLAKDLGLTQLLFRYGVRVNPTLIRDFSQSASLSLITDEYNGNPVFTDFKWYYYPLSNYSPSKNPIVENIAPVRFEFVSTMDTLNISGIKKEILLATSETTAVQGTLSEVNLASVDLEPNLSEFDKKNQIMAVLLEGTFTSAFKNRVHSFDFKYENQSPENKMIVVADGDIAKSSDNQIIGGNRSHFIYGNEDFLLNSIEYLLDNDAIFLLKNKTFDIQFLDPEKLQNTKSFWKWFNLTLPLIVLWIVCLIITKTRYVKYCK